MVGCAENFVPYQNWLREEWNEHYHHVSTLCCSPDGRYTLAGDSKGYLALFSLCKYLSASHWLGSGIPDGSPSSEIHFRANYTGIHSLCNFGDLFLSYVWGYMYIV